MRFIADHFATDYNLGFRYSGPVYLPRKWEMLLLMFYMVPSIHLAAYLILSQRISRTIRLKLALPWKFPTLKGKLLNNKVLICYIIDDSITSLEIDYRAFDAVSKRLCP